MVRMKVQRIGSDQHQKPYVILSDMEEEHILPILIGVAEALAIYFELEKQKFGRPMTHDLICNMLKQLGAKLERVRINDFRDGTFYAVLHLTVNGTDYEVDARPSDAIAVALRAEAPIYVEDDIITLAGFRATEGSQYASLASERAQEEIETFRTILEDIDLEEE